MSRQPCSGLSTGGGTGAVQGSSSREGGVPELAPVPVPPHRDLADELELWPFPSAVPCARSHATAVLTEWGLNGLVDDGALIVSELITNAVAAASAMADTFPVLLRLFLINGHLLIEAWDANPTLPEPRVPDADDESGRGLFIVSVLSEACGTDMSADGRKVVWARIRL